MEYKHGVRLTPLVHELSPLEAAIERYAQKAKHHFQQVSKADFSAMTPTERKEQEKALREALEHLEHERRLAEVTVEVQTELEHYRTQGRNATQGSFREAAVAQRALIAETHHPTKLLERYLRADGRPKPSAQHSAHHVVPGKGKTKAANRARLHIHGLGVRINDPDNGTWLVRHKRDTPHWSMPQSLAHLQYHTYNYETWIYRSVSLKRSEDTLRFKLRLLGRMLQQGNYPKHVTLPPDSSWDGKA
jgi:hypothetical protein